MKVLLAGDTHTDIYAIQLWLNKLARADVVPDLVLQLGDFGFYRGYGNWDKYRDGRLKFQVPTIVIHGNHEAPKHLAEAYTLDIPNFKLLDTGAIVEFTKGGETLRIMGVGGAWSVDNPPKDQMIEFSSNDYLVALDEWINKGKPQIDILMTHECPYAVNMLGNPWIAKRFNLPPNEVMGDANLRKLWEAVKPKLQVNGHHHRYNEFTDPHTDLRHLTLPTIQEGAALLDTETWEYLKL